MSGQHWSLPDRESPHRSGAPVPEGADRAIAPSPPSCPMPLIGQHHMHLGILSLTGWKRPERKYLGERGSNNQDRPTNHMCCGDEQPAAGSGLPYRGWCVLSQSKGSWRQTPNQGGA